jgi:hypothetical protein
MPAKCFGEPIPPSDLPYPANEDPMIFYAPMLDFSKSHDEFSPQLQANFIFEQEVQLYVKNDQNRLKPAPAFVDGTRIMRRTSTKHHLHAQNRTKLHFRYNDRDVTVVMKTDYFLDGRGCGRLDKEITGGAYASGEGPHNIVRFNVTVTPLPMNKLVRITWDLDSTHFDKLFNPAPVVQPPAEKPCEKTGDCIPLNRQEKALYARIRELEIKVEQLMADDDSTNSTHTNPEMGDDDEDDGCVPIQQQCEVDLFHNMEVNEW